MKTWVKVDSSNVVIAIWTNTHSANPLGDAGTDLIEATDNDNVELGSTYDPGTGTFTPPSSEWRRAVIASSTGGQPLGNRESALGLPAVDRIAPGLRGIRGPHRNGNRRGA